ncbi:MAG: DUF4384 domain-containing protein [Pyrinomonadaceae bacterium]
MDGIFERYFLRSKTMIRQSKRYLILVFSLVICFPQLVIDTSGQGLSSGDSVFVFKRPKGASGVPQVKSAYQVGKQLPQRQKPSIEKPANETKSASGSGKSATKTPINLPSNEQLGITLWRLRPERSGDTGARLLTMAQNSNSETEMVAERVAMDTVFQKGEKVRISVESPRAGYLYIIDREIRKDDTVGDPYLIFPTLKTHNGDNRVGAGKVVEIPAQTDNPFYFEITPSEANYSGELLTVIVSPTKIDGLNLTDKPIQLSASQVEKWEGLCERSATTFELESSRGLVYTEEEKEAGMGSRQLTQSSPAPQTMISVQAPVGKAFLVSFMMKASM